MTFEINTSEATVYFFRFRGTVIRRIFWTVVVFSLYVCAVVLLHFYVQRLNVFNSIVGSLGIIISLLLGFRANNSIARYNEGRAAFASMKKTVRSMSQTVWIQVPVHTAQDLVEKKTIINFLETFCYALKHYLREEYSYAEPDMLGRTKFLPQFCGRPKTLPSKGVMGKLDCHVAREFKPPTNIPQEILYNLTLYSQYTCDKNPDINAAFWTAGFVSGISALEATLTNLESLQRTPMPVCYASHLSHSFWIYLVALPFQIVGTFGWWTVPVVGLGFFFFIGVMSLSLELEDPFGYDDNDLPLDDFCCTIRNELNEITGAAVGDAESWILSPENMPLSPYSQISATEWAEESMEEAQHLLFGIQVKPWEERSRLQWKEAGLAQTKQDPAPPPTKQGVDNVALDVADEHV